MRVNLRCETRSYSEIQQADYTNECIWRNIFIKPWTSGLTVSVLCASFSCVIASNTQYHVGFPPAGSYHTFITATYCLCDSLWSAVLSLCHFSQEWKERLATFHLSSWPTLPPHLSTAQPRAFKSQMDLKSICFRSRKKIECCACDRRLYWNEMTHILISCTGFCSHF